MDVTLHVIDMVSDVTIAPTRGYGTRWPLKKIRVSETPQEYLFKAVCFAGRSKIIPQILILYLLSYSIRRRGGRKGNQ